MDVKGNINDDFNLILNIKKKKVNIFIYLINKKSVTLFFILILTIII